MSEMRRCKECGELFVPKGREQYCSKLHYRPCPVCGEPVEAKYLSDPPRKCSNCRGKKMQPMSSAAPMQVKPLFTLKPMQVAPVNAPSKPAKPAPVSVDNSWMKDAELVEIDKPIEAPAFCEKITGTVMMYIGNAHKNSFIPGHKYLLKVQKELVGCYEVIGTEDLTSGEEVSLIRPFASQISFYQMFANFKEEPAV